MDAIIKSGHSRIPVYEGTNDRIVGIVYAKDLLRYWGSDADATDVQQVMRAPYFVPETKKIEDLLQEFRSKRVHIAIVVDEYGGTSGLITIEDLLEEIVGEIQDEYDSETALLVAEKSGTVLVDARLSIEEIEEYFDNVVKIRSGGHVYVRPSGIKARDIPKFFTGTLRGVVLANRMYLYVYGIKPIFSDLGRLKYRLTRPDIKLDKIKDFVFGNAVSLDLSRVKINLDDIKALAKST